MHQCLFGPAASWQVVDILLGTPPPDGMKGDGIAYKTGTSYGYRDAWAVGFDGRLVIGVWVGRAGRHGGSRSHRAQCRGADSVRDIRGCCTRAR